jgi:hypothetical protein
MCIQPADAVNVIGGGKYFREGIGGGGAQGRTPRKRLTLR